MVVVVITTMRRKTDTTPSILSIRCSRNYCETIHARSSNVFVVAIIHLTTTRTAIQCLIITCGFGIWRNFHPGRWKMAALSGCINSDSKCSNLLRSQQKKSNFTSLNPGENAIKSKRSNRILLTWAPLRWVSFVPQ